MDVLEAIYSRRSVRNFTAENPHRQQILEIIKAGSWAPSGLNNQPWRFFIIRDCEMRRSMAAQTKYRRVIETAPVAIAVFCDRSAMYNDTKDHQAIGACLQNMLLAAHAMGLGAVWLGEILKNSDQVRGLLQLPAELELMAVVAVGYESGKSHLSERKKVDALIVGEK